MAGVPKRTLAQKERAKAAVLGWRSRLFEIEYASAWSYYTVRAVMTDDQVKVLSESFAKIMVGESVQSIANWAPWKEQHANELTNILIDLNNEIDDDRRTTLQKQHQVEQVNNDRNKVADSHHVEVVPPILHKPIQQTTFINFSAKDVSNRISKRNGKVNNDP